jgi:hypothetical protein
MYEADVKSKEDERAMLASTCLTAGCRGEILTPEEARKRFQHGNKPVCPIGWSWKRVYNTTATAAAA